MPIPLAMMIFWLAIIGGMASIFADPGEGPDGRP
jgi:hypothetical protein